MSGTFKWSRFLLLGALLAGAAYGVYLYFYINDLVQPVLVPMNQSYVGYSNLPKKALGLHLEPFSFQGWDGCDVQAVIATKEGEESSRQLSVMADLAVTPAERLKSIDYVLVCVDWDHGIRSALPLAESLTAAGLKCVLWEPRGANSSRPYCTHGLTESRDVQLLLDALTARSGKEKLLVAAVGQGFGAGLLLKAAAEESRIAGLISVDAYASLRQSLDRSMETSPLKPLTLLLMDMKINSAVGFECFDVAPVENASRLRRNLPVLVINMAQDNPVSTLRDAVTIYRQLPCDERSVATLRGPEDAPSADTRELDFKVGNEQKQRIEKLQIELMKDEDSCILGMIHWLNDVMLPSLNKAQMMEPERPELSPDMKL